MTPAKKTAPRRSPRAAKPAGGPAGAGEVTDGVPGGGVQPVIIGRRGPGGDTPPVEMVTIAVVDDVPYQIPKNPSAALVLSWILDVQKLGLGDANLQMGVQLLGEATLRALAASPQVGAEDVKGIFANIGDVFFGSDNFKAISGAADPS